MVAGLTCAAVGASAVWVILTNAVDRGSDVIGMAGGDGSQAAVAAAAAARGVPFVCVPAGTRNHLALDLGIERDDVVGSARRPHSISGMAPAAPGAGGVPPRDVAAERRAPLASSTLVGLMSLVRGRPSGLVG
jgi:hypothetical protein